MINWIWVFIGGIVFGVLIEYILWILRLKKNNLFDKEGNLKKGAKKE